MTVFIIKLDSSAKKITIDGKEIFEDEEDSIEELVVYNEDKLEMIAYLNWLSDSDKL